MQTKGLSSEAWAWKLEPGWLEPIIARSQSTGSRSKSSWYAEPRPKLAIWCLKFAWYIGKRFLLVHLHLFRQISQECFILRILMLTGNIPEQASTRRPVAGNEEHNRDTILTPRFARRSSAKNSFIPVEGRYSENYLADKQRLHFSELHFWHVPYTFNILMLEDKIQNQSMFLFKFPTEAMLWSKELEIGDSVDDQKIIVLYSRRYSFPEFRGARRENCIIPEQDHPEFLPQKRRSVWREQKAQKEDRFLRGRQIAYMIYDYFWVSGVHDTVLDYADLFTVALRSDDIQEFDTRWDEILLSMTKFPQMKSWKVSTT